MGAPAADMHWPWAMSPFMHRFLLSFSFKVSTVLYMNNLKGDVYAQPLSAS